PSEIVRYKRLCRLMQCASYPVRLIQNDQHIRSVYSLERGWIVIIRLPTKRDQFFLPSRESHVPFGLVHPSREVPDRMCSSYLAPENRLNLWCARCARYNKRLANGMSIQPMCSGSSSDPTFPNPMTSDNRRPPVLLYGIDDPFLLAPKKLA